MFKLAYCDKIADVISKALKREIEAPVYASDGIIHHKGAIESDLHPIDGYFVSPKKLIKVWDMNGKAYSITIEEQPALDIVYEDIEQKEVDNEFK